MTQAQPQTQTENKIASSRKWKMPNTLILIFIIGLMAAGLSYLVPVGQFDTQTVSFVADGVEKTRTVIDPDRKSVV